MGFRSLSIQPLRDRGVTKETLVLLGGEIQRDGLNVCFAVGDSYDKAAELLKLPLRPKREPRETGRERIKREGPQYWAGLHRWAFAFMPSDEAEKIAGVWLLAFARKLPCGDCRNHWRAMMRRTPPPFTSAAELFTWTVDRHNEVNAKLDKPDEPHPQISMDAARGIWEHKQQE